MSDKLRDRHQLAFDWLPPGCQVVLDGGCAFGSGTAPLANKVKRVFGCDPNPELIAHARASYPNLTFEVCPLERTPYENAMFDAVVLTDVLEHVVDERIVINELFRVLKPGGHLILTVPHKGLFSFMDTENYIWILQTKFPRLHRLLFRMKHGNDPRSKAGYGAKHRHYSLSDLAVLLDNSHFKNHYEIDRVFYGSLFFYVLMSNLFELLSLLIGPVWAKRLLYPLEKLSDWDYFVSYGKLSYNIGIRVKKRLGHSE
jgi:SAM-dependent methyltransferase